MPVMAICALIVLIGVLTFGTPDPMKPDQSVLGGLGCMWNPNYKKLGDFKTWLAAASQVFFSLSLGFGGMITLMAAFVFLGLSGTLVAVVGGTFKLGFATLPVVFAHMGWFENIRGALWFLVLWLAAIKIPPFVKIIMKYVAPASC